MKLNKDTHREQIEAAWIFGIVFILAMILLFMCKPSEAGVDTNKWADAIYKAEGGHNATYLYGIRSIPYDTEIQARRYCKNTVYNTLVKYRASRCREGEQDIDCLARRYCPIGASNDPKGLNKNWKRNVLAFMRETR